MAAVIPPLDATHQTPSSFDQLVVKFNQIAGPDPTPQGLLDAAAALTDAEIETLAASGNHKEPIENEQDEKIFALGMAEGLASPDGTKHMINAGDAAAEAARETRSLFRSLQLRIVQIDAIHRSGFLPQLIEIFTKFEGVLRESQELAVKISIHGDRFEDQIIPFCTDENIDRTRRAETIQGFITEMEETLQAGRAMETRFFNLQTSFTNFVSYFSIWARDREDQLTNEITQAMNELQRLDDKLSDIHETLMEIRTSNPWLVRFEIMRGSIMPFLRIAGWIGLRRNAEKLATIAALGEKKTRTEREIVRAEAHLDRLQNNLERIRHSREHLIQMGKGKLNTFSDNVQAIESVWNAVSVDAQRIVGLLDGSVLFVDLPEWMVDGLEHANSIYMSMTEYLMAYAKNITV